MRFPLSPPPLLAQNPAQKTHLAHTERRRSTRQHQVLPKYLEILEYLIFEKLEERWESDVGLEGGGREGLQDQREECGWEVGGREEFEERGVD